MPSLKNCHNIADLRLRAKSKLPSPMFHYIDGGADDEWTQRRNTRAFDDYTLMPSQLCDVSRIDLSTRVLNYDLQLPIIITPTGMSRLFHQDKELAVARAAASRGQSPASGWRSASVSAMTRLSPTTVPSGRRSAGTRRAGASGCMSRAIVPEYRPIMWVV